MKGATFSLVTNAFAKGTQPCFPLFFLKPKLFFCQTGHGLFPLYTPLGFPCPPTRSPTTPMPYQASEPLTRSISIFSSLTPLPNPPQAELKYHLCTRSPLLHSACTHAFEHQSNQIKSKPNQIKSNQKIQNKSNQINQTKSINKIKPCIRPSILHSACTHAFDHRKITNWRFLDSQIFFREMSTRFGKNWKKTRGSNWPPCY